MALHAARARATPAFLCIYSFKHTSLKWNTKEERQIQTRNSDSRRFPMHAYVEFTVPYMYSIMYWYCLQGSIRVRTALPGGGRDDRKIRFHPNQSSSEICQLNWLMSDTVD